jgi:hypothetical protein
MVRAERADTSRQRKRGEAHPLLALRARGRRLLGGGVRNPRVNPIHTAWLLDAEGNLLEASHANLLVRLPDGWATPTANGGLLPGTVRRYLLEHAPLPIREQTIPHTRLGEVREAFVTNSNIGIVPVTRIDGYTFPIGNETLDLMRWLQPPPGSGIQYRFVERQATPR